MNDYLLNDQTLHPLDPLLVGPDGLAAKLSNALATGVGEAEVWRALRDCRKLAAGRGRWAV